jgi:hypothetical protein
MKTEPDRATDQSGRGLTASALVTSGVFVGGAGNSLNLGLSLGWAAQTLRREPL